MLYNLALQVVNSGGQGFSRSSGRPCLQYESKTRTLYLVQFAKFAHAQTCKASRESQADCSERCRHLHPVLLLLLAILQPTYDVFEKFSILGQLSSSQLFHLCFRIFPLLFSRVQLVLGSASAMKSEDRVKRSVSYVTSPLVNQLSSVM